MYFKPVSLRTFIYSSIVNALFFTSLSSDFSYFGEKVPYCGMTFSC